MMINVDLCITVPSIVYRTYKAQKLTLGKNVNGSSKWVESRI